MTLALRAQTIPAGRVRAAWVMAACMLASVLAVDPGGLRPFTTLRWPILAAGVLVGAVLVWPARATLPRSVRWLAMAFLSWMLLATLLAVDPLHAWIGHPQRHFGMLTWLLCALAGWLGATLTDGRTRSIIGLGAIVACGVIGVGALADMAGLGPADIDFAGGRIGGPYGLPSYLGAAGTLLVPVAFGAAATLPHPWRRVGQAAGVLGLVSVVASQTRGAWIGLVVGGVLVAPALLRALRLFRARRADVALPLGALTAGVGVLIVAALAVWTPLGSRALSTFDLGAGTSLGRVHEWRVAAEVVAEHPLVGVGPEGYRVVAPSHIDHDYGKRYGRDAIVDRAHDGPLDVVVTAGLPAALAYLGLAAVVVGAAWRLRRDRRPFLVGAAAGVTGYLAQQLFLFPVAEIEPMMWLLAGMILAGAYGGGGGRDGDRGEPRGSHGDERRPRDRVVRTALGIAAAAFVIAGILDVAADRKLAAAAEAMDEGHHGAAVAASEQATRLRPDSVDAWYVAAEVAARGESLVDLDIAIEKAREGLERSGRDPALLDLRERLAVERAVRSGLADDRKWAREIVMARMAADPANPLHPGLLGALSEASPGGGSGSRLGGLDG